MTSLSAKNWCQHKEDILLWAPTPAAADTLLELLLESWIQQTYTTNLMVVPSLMIFLRIKQMGKEVDLLFTVPVGIPFWVLGEHEPPIIALFLPIVSRRNWKGTVTIHGSDWGRGRVRQLNWSVSGNGISLDLFKWRGIREKCRKKVVKDTRIFFEIFCLGRG